MGSRTTVLKLGGSLLDWPEWPAALTDLVARLGGDRPLLIVGGGPAADVVRDWSREHRLDEETAHWLAIDALGLTARFVRTRLPNAVIVTNRDEAEAAWEAKRLPILDPAPFLRREEPAADEPLPHIWDVTSDSLAAWIGLVWPADRLVMLKSIPRPAGPVTNAMRAGAVDPYFAGLAGHYAAVDWCWLRHPAPGDRLRPWLRGGAPCEPSSS